jgi:hypothetical protein
MEEGFVNVADNTQVQPLQKIGVLQVVYCFYAVQPGTTGSPKTLRQGVIRKISAYTQCIRSPVTNVGLV